MRKRRNTFVICSIMVLCATMLISCTSSQPVKEKPILDSPQTNENIIEMYQKLIKLREQFLTNQLELAEYGRSSVLELTNAKVKLSNARIELLKLQGKHDMVVKELRNIVQFYTEQMELIKKEVEKGQRPSLYLDKIEIELLEAKIRLAKVMQQKN